MNARTIPAPAPENQAQNDQPEGAQTRISCAPQLVSGLDTIHLSLSCSIPEGVLTELKAAKEKIQEGPDGSALWKFGETNLFAWELSRVGVKLFPYILRSGDITFALSSRSTDSRIPNAQLSIGSLSSNNNPLQLLDTIKKWMQLYGMEIKKETVARADIFVDLECDIAKLHLVSQSRMVTRAEKVANFFSNRRLSGVQVGTSSIVLRIYDKLLEMQEKRATAKQEFFFTTWGKIPEHVTRVEFQLRRDALREFFLESCTLAELHAKLPETWKYLSEEWFRQTARAVDRENRNQSRETTSDFWRCVQAAFDVVEKALDRTKKLKVFNLRALIEQAGGIMATIAAGLGLVHDDLFAIRALMQDTIGDQVARIIDEKGHADFYRRAVVASITV